MTEGDPPVRATAGHLPGVTKPEEVAEPAGFVLGSRLDEVTPPSGVALVPVSTAPGGAALDSHHPPAALIARSVNAWHRSRRILDNVSLTMAPGTVTALVGPPGAGRTTFLRILNRLHDEVRGATMTGTVELDGIDVYGPALSTAHLRKSVGMIFPGPNLFPTLTIAQTVLSGPRVAGIRVANRDSLVGECLDRAGLWKEVQGRLNDRATGLTAGQQVRLCVARALAVRPRVLLMDEPCSTLDPEATSGVEEVIRRLCREVTIVIATHNVAQAHRIASTTAVFLRDGEDGPGTITAAGPTRQMFSDPGDRRSSDYLNGRSG